MNFNLAPTRYLFISVLRLGSTVSSLIIDEFHFCLELFYKAVNYSIMKHTQQT